MPNIPTDNMPQIMQPAAMLQAVYESSRRSIRTVILGPDGTPISSTNPAPVQIMGSSLSPLVTLQNGASAAVNGADLPTSGHGVALLEVSGTFVGTITFEAKGPSGAYYAVSGFQRGTGALSTTFTVPGLYEINTRGLTAVRARISSYTSGSITIQGQAQPLSAGGEIVRISGSGYLDLGEIINTPVIAAGGVIVEVGFHDNLQWVRSIVGLCQSDQVTQIVAYRKEPSGASDYGYTIGGTIPVAGGAAWTNMVTAMTVGYSCRFGIKNTGTVPTTFTKLRLQLLGF